ncbi:MAG: hypothetical protein ABIN36_02450 [Ferruginibacter sp.]
MGLIFFVAYRIQCGQYLHDEYIFFLATRLPGRDLLLLSVSGSTELQFRPGIPLDFFSFLFLLAGTKDLRIEFNTMQAVVLRPLFHSGAWQIGIFFPMNKTINAAIQRIKGLGKMRADALDTMINIAEKELNIPIRKKPGARESNK